ncbi:hypothetical protein QBC46DRAFT_48292 [Diplogelasinospora grovesii]|uniref:Uncharacterized protein n=1 Tax=Diplogelasinospora grovesii TaxID=303347 RepID=A0AAN6S7Q1_9PEZI|nr:hypothetical protein QBC46DRAFT_48292 [Diplogelasinospora grovesii]
MATESAPAYTPATIETIRPEDFETASIRSAAPSYTSDAPSYHSTVPVTHSTVPRHTEPIPPYSPPAAPLPNFGGRAPSAATSSSSAAAAAASTNRSQAATTSSAPSSGRQQQQYGLPPVPTGPLPSRRSQMPLQLSEFRIPSWSNLSTANPTARQYQRVALRRTRAAAASSSMESPKKMALERCAEEEEQQHQQRNRVRPLEDPYLVGEEAAARARRERLARESFFLGDEVLVREDRRWDWFLAQMSDWEEREASWKRYRQQAE